MRKLSLTPESLVVTSFSAAPAPAGTAASLQTNEYECLTLTLLAEDCFGPSAGCYLDETAA